MIVVSIIAILIAIAVPRMTRVLQAQKVNASKIAMRSIGGTLDVYRTEHDEYPEDMATLVRDGFLKEKQVRDPWNNPFKYLAQEDSDGFRTDYKLASRGPDKRDNTDDDIQCEDHEFQKSDEQRAKDKRLGINE
jgi:type II secretory pathway pseudopilin PulG